MPRKIPIVVLRHRRNVGYAAMCGARGHALVFVMNAALVTCPTCATKHAALLREPVRL